MQVTYVPQLWCTPPWWKTAVSDVVLHQENSLNKICVKKKQHNDFIL